MRGVSWGKEGDGRALEGSSTIAEHLAACLPAFLLPLLHCCSTSMCSFIPGIHFQK